MPYGDPDASDPNVLVGVQIPAEREAMREMAYAFAEEFAALGFDENRLFNLFRRPFYAGAHGAYRALGEAAIRDIIRESVAVWGRFRVKVTDADDSGRPDIRPLVQISVPERGSKKETES